MEKITLIAGLSWEDRCLEGIKDDLNSNSIGKLILYCNEHSKELDAENSRAIEGYCRSKQIETVHIHASYDDPVRNWKEIQSFCAERKTGEKILVDITTMPREIIWMFLSFLRQANTEIFYVYHKPGSYDGAWLSREPGKPRLVFKHSGIAKLGKPTAIMVLTGFDCDRTRQLVTFYEPKVALLGLQKGSQFDNHIRNKREKHFEECEGSTEIREFELDAYSEDHGFFAIKEQLKKLKDYNVITTSLGPKLSAVALYRLHSEHPEIALSYVPAKEYNPEYSHGIGEKIAGKF